MFNNSQTETRDTLSSFLGKTYGFMTLGILISALAAYTTVHLMPRLAVSTGFAIGSGIITLIIAFVFSKATIRNPATGLALFILFSVLTGMSLSSLAFAYTGATITGAFISASAIFLAMAFLGTTTKVDMSGWGIYLLVGLIGIVIVSIVAIFMHSPMLNLIISILSVILFTGYTAYDAQLAQRSYDKLSRYGISSNSMAIIHAFNLYLDFINLFVDLVQILGIFDNR